VTGELALILIRVKTPFLFGILSVLNLFCLALLMCATLPQFCFSCINFCFEYCS